MLIKREDAKMAISPRMAILFDNYPGLPGLEALWGFAAFFQMPERTVLFDTGSNGRVLLRNMAALGIEPTSIDLLFLSHPHWDHIGGLDSVLELNPHITVVAHEGFSKHLIRDLESQCRELILAGKEPRQLAPGIFSTGMLDSEPPEHAMVIVLPDSVVAISGCAHSGMEAIVEHARRFLNKRVDWAIGGFHLMYADSAQITRSIRSLQDLGVRFVVPTHCTGDEAVAGFRRAYGSCCVFGGVGREVVFDKNAASSPATYA
jgi:7,8-dihydropterin-6-yl-methyl-4-(beta-D-ribofuranosyl)aminobenzene 5'-phosphate synthase